MYGNGACVLRRARVLRRLLRSTHLVLISIIPLGLLCTSFSHLLISNPTGRTSSPTQGEVVRTTEIPSDDAFSVRLPTDPEYAGVAWHRPSKPKADVSKLRVTYKCYAQVNITVTIDEDGDEEDSTGLSVHRCMVLIFGQNYSLEVGICISAHLLS
jgi:hypothetical protein